MNDMHPNFRPSASEFNRLTAENAQLREERDNADAVQAIQIAAAKQALQDVTEGVTEMEIEIARLRAELKTSNAERDEARRQVCDWYNTDESGCVKSGSHETARARGWDCFKNQETT